jgi:hypothetical protein
VGPDTGNLLVKKYRDPEKMLAAIPHNERLPTLPRTPFIGEVSFLDIIGILEKNRRWFTRPERRVAEDLVDYLHLKRARVPPKWAGWHKPREGDPEPRYDQFGPLG